MVSCCSVVCWLVGTVVVCCVDGVDGIVVVCSGSVVVIVLASVVVVICDEVSIVDSVTVSCCCVNDVDGSSPGDDHVMLPAAEEVVVGDVTSSSVAVLSSVKSVSPVVTSEGVVDVGSGVGGSVLFLLF